MTCKLHIPYLYDPTTETYSCDCGAVQETKADRALGRKFWREPPRTHVKEFDKVEFVKHLIRQGLAE
jgi:hypothetical protein